MTPQSIMLLSGLILGLACGLVMYHAALDRKKPPSPRACLAAGLAFGLLALGIFFLDTRRRTQDVTEEGADSGGEEIGTHPTTRQAAVLFFTVMVVMIFGSLVARSSGVLGLVLTVQLLGVLLPTLLYSRYLRLASRPLFRWRRISLASAGLATLIGLLMSVLAGSLYALSAKVLGAPPAEMSLSNQFMSLTGGGRWVLAAAIVLLPALGEEWLFRGFLLKAYLPKGRTTAVFLTAVLFACFHLNPWYFMKTLLLGVVAALVVEWTDSTYTSSLLHGANNLVGTVPILAGAMASSAGKMQTLPPWPVVVIAVVGVTLCLWGLWRLNQRAGLAADTVPALDAESGQYPQGIEANRKPITRLIVRGFAVVSVILLLAFAAMALRQRGTFTNSFNRGMRAYQRGDYDVAISGFTTAIQRDPTRVTPYDYRAWSYQKKGEYDRAIADCNTALTINPACATVYNNRGWAYYNKRMYDRALTDLSKAIQLAPRFALAYNNRGAAFLAKRQYDQALSDFDAAIRLAPRFATAYSNRGLVYTHKNDLDQALDDLNKAIRLDHKLAMAYNNRGWAYQKKGRWNSAIADYTEAIRLNGKEAKAYHNRGHAYVKQARYDRAIADFTESIRLVPESAPEVYLDRGWAYCEKGDFDRAIADCNKTIELDPKVPRAYNTRGWVFQKMGKYDRAIADYNQAIRLDPQMDLAYHNRAHAHAKKGEYDRAIADFTQSIRLDAKHANYYTCRAHAYAKKSDHGRAIADCTKAIQLDPTSGRPYNGAAWLLATCTQDKVRDGRKAVAYATKACELTKWKNGFYLDTLAAAYAESGQFETAVKWEKEALKCSEYQRKDRAKDKQRAAQRIRLYEEGKAFREVADP